MAYKVIRPFRDLRDSKQHDYATGDTFPREGYEPSDEFVRSLLTGSNTTGSIFLTFVAEEPELPEGDKVTVEEVPVEKPKSKRVTKKAEV